jgi:hypothetical protein
MKVTKENWRNFRLVVSLLALAGAVSSFMACENPSQFGNSAPDAARSLSLLKGAKADPIVIDNERDLASIGTSPDFPANGDYILDADLELDDWTPICSPSNAFTGTFDGNGHTITVTGFSDDALEGTNPIGIFSQIGNGSSGGSVSNLTVNITASAFNTAAINVGGVAGKALGASGALVSFNNITVSGMLNATYNGSDIYSGFQIGGIVGRVELATISQSQSSTLVTGYGEAYNTSAGGIAGYVLQTSITNSNATGGVNLSAETAVSGSDFWQIYAGGLAGYQGVQSTISECFATGNVTLTAAVIAEAPYPYAGGLLGYNYGYNNFVDPPSRGSTVSKSYATGNVRAIAQSGTGGIPTAGGLVGYNSVSGSTIEDSYATGDVFAETEGQYSWAGGLCGANAQDALIQRCYATGRVAATAGIMELPYPQPDIDTGASAGGLAGYNFNYKTPGTTQILNSVALNPRVDGTATSPTPINVYRFLGHDGTTYGPGGFALDYANVDMILTPSHPTYNPVLDGSDCAAQPPDTFYSGTLLWDFTNVWVKETTDAYPVLKWQRL